MIHRDPEILSGTPVFIGTRVPVQSLFAYQGGDTLDDFLRQFPSVRREHAVAALEQVYGAITFYLGHKDDVDSDVAARERAEDAFQPGAEGTGCGAP